MVKHQRRSHQRGGGVNSSELEDGDTIAIHPQLVTQAHWPQDLNTVITHNVVQSHQAIHRSHSFAEFGHHNQGYVGSEVYPVRHSLSESPQHYQHRSLSLQDQRHPQDLIQRQPTIHQQHPYFISDQNNPNLHIHTYMARPMPDRQLPYNSQPIPGPDGSSDTYFALSARTPPPPDLYYAPQPLQKFEYPVHQQSPIDQVPVVQYQQQHAPMAHAPAQAIPNPSPVAPQPHQQFQQQTPQEQWYAQAPFQEPVGVISAINSYTSAGLYDPWQVKLEAFEDPSMQLPSARCENL
ncbi:hypothetical protein ACLOAV_010263 [Pseudogymnoascus australis]